MVALATEVRWQDRRFAVPLERVLLTERVGYDAVFTAEGYGSDALTPLGYIAARTRRLKLGTRILQVTGRPPAVAAMALQTLDQMAGGDRVIAGIGSGSPHSGEGLYGQPWGHPVARMRDYVAIMRQAFDGGPLDHIGAEWSAPYRGPGAVGIEPLALGLDTNPKIPIVIAASGPVVTELAAEIGDGWMPSAFAPGLLATFLPLLEKGFAAAGSGKSLDGFQIWAHVDMLVDDDVRTAMRPFKEYVVQWSAMQRPFMVNRGYPDLADRLAELTSAGRREDAIEAVPDDYIDDGWLVGPVERIRRRVEPWLDCGLTGLIVRYGPQIAETAPVENLDAFRVIAEAAGKEPAPD